MYRALPGSLVAFFDKPASLGFTFAGALGLPGAGHVEQSGVLSVGYSSSRILRNSLMG